MVVDGQGRVRWSYEEWPGEEWAGWHLLVLTARDTPPEYLACLRSGGIPYLIAGEQRVDLAGALEKLGSQLGVTHVLSQGAGKLNGAPLRAGLLSEINVDLFPAVIGGCETPALFDSPALEPDEWPIQLQLIAVRVQAEGAYGYAARLFQNESESPATSQTSEVSAAYLTRGVSDVLQRPSTKRYIV